MTYYEHALIQIRKFKTPELFTELLILNKFLDSSKYLYPHFKHRLILHHTYGAELAVKIFGDYIGNGLLVRDVAFEHCREDHGIIPTLNDWSRGTGISDLKSRINDTINNEDATWLDNVKFNERWMYTPDRKEIKWLKSEERFNIEKNIYDTKKRNIR